MQEPSLSSICQHQSSLSSTRPLVSRRTTPSTQLEMQGSSRSREEHSRNEAQGHRERLVLTELGDTSKLVTDLTQSQHMNLHIRQSIAGAAAGTLRKYLQHWTFWSEWALECGTLTLVSWPSQTWPIFCMKWYPEPVKIAPA